MGPGLTALTRMPRERSSPERVAGKREQAGLGCGVDTGVGHADMGVNAGIENNRCGIAEGGKQRPDKEERTLEVNVNGAIKGCLVPQLEGAKVGNTGVDEEDVKVAEGLSNRIC